MLVAVEPSADAIGADFIRSMRQRVADVQFLGCGGPLMAAEGFQSAFDTRELAVMGFTDVARVLFKGLAQARTLAAMAAENEVDAAVFIDGWAFSRICAVRFKKSAPQALRIKLAAPQVWASRPQRVEFVRDYFDGVLTLLPFEAPWFDKVGVKTAFIGNPNFQTAFNNKGDGTAFRTRHGIHDDSMLVVLPGSREGELKRHASVFGETVSRLCTERPGLKVVVPAAPAVRNRLGNHIKAWPVQPVIVGSEEKFDAFAGADVALAVSGTVSTELAINGAPMVVAYRVDALTAVWARQVMTAKYASIINIAADKEIIPELLQEECTPEKLEQAIAVLLDDKETARRQTELCATVLASLDLDGPPASDLAAQQVLDWIASGVAFSRSQNLHRAPGNHLE